MLNNFIYIISVLLSFFALSGVNFDSFIKKNHVSEARVLLFLLSIGLGYLVGSFILLFLGS